MFKRGVIWMLALCLIFGMSGCGNASDGEVDMRPIEYEMSDTAKEMNEEIAVSVPDSCMAGEAVTASARVQPKMPNTYTYSILDWGDGTWSYLGPGILNLEASTTFSVEHVYQTEGTYFVRAAVVDMRQGSLLGWSPSAVVQVSGNYQRDDMIRNVSFISSPAYDRSHEAENIADNDNETSFRSIGTTAVDNQAYVGYLFDDYYSLDCIEIKFPKNEEIFPSNIAVEYTMDGGETWHHFTKYYYLNKYAEGAYQPFMGFPNPNGATLSLGLDKMVGNGIRFTVKMFSTENPRETKYLNVSEMRVYGEKEKLFESGFGGAYDAALNNMFTIYGTAESEWQYNTSLIGENPSKEYFRTGIAMIGSTEWLEWNGMKLIWTDYDAAKQSYYSVLKGTVRGEDGWQDEYDGYIWATAMLSDTWLASPKHLGLQNHYTYNAIYICAVRNFLLQNNAISSFEETSAENLLQVKNLLGQSVMENIEAAMEYNLKALQGETGVLTILDPNNDGTADGVSSNYWDYYNFFGYKSAYENILFYRSLAAMADIYEWLGESEKAAYYTDLRELTKEKFNETFWDSEKGRYIASVDINGVRHDFGMTFVSFMACEAGLASEDQAQQIYSWIDGDRIVEGDTSTGSDIYYFKFAARSNTVDMKEAPELCWTHDGLLDPSTASGRYGSNIQQGGAIFYTSYYDIMGRLQYLGADNANGRLQAIIDEFLQDELRRFTLGTTGAEGIIGEFPESGIVPLVFLHGFMGISSSVGGIAVSPSLPSGMHNARISRYCCNDRVYDISISDAISQPSLTTSSEKITVCLPAEGEWLISWNDTIEQIG